MDTDKGKIEQFKKQLDKHYRFPTRYLFKFIVPEKQVDKLKEIIPDGKIETRKSKNGRYIGVTIKLSVKSSEEIISIYQDAYAVEGIISL